MRSIFRINHPTPKPGRLSCGQTNEPRAYRHIAFRIQYMKDLVIKRVQNLCWDITYAGEPDPEVRWFFGDQELIPDGDRYLSFIIKTQYYASV